MKKFFIIVVRGLVALIAIAACIGVVVDYGGRVGAAAGLMLGTLYGPGRIVGVDFRQWFRDPGTPSELSDDSPIGLMRGGFHALWISAALALLALSHSVCVWMPSPCTMANPSPFADMLPERFYLDTAARLFVDFLTSCSPVPAALKFLGGAAVGAAFVQAMVEITWRLGLAVGTPPPSRPRDYLATQGLSRVRLKANHPGRRRLIVCCDGTWNWPESRRETNIVRLVRAIAPDDDGVAQIVHYHQGVGTGNFIDRVAGGGAGVGLSASVKACYGFLVDNYREHDEIFLFGFSRGAYVARSLGGMIGSVGMMRKFEMDRFADVWNWYWQDKADRDGAVLDDLARDRVRDVDIECIGVWDTVGALGIPGTRFCARTFAFHETELGPHVRHAFQALAIDERRPNFQGAVWVPFDPGRSEPPAAYAGGPAAPRAAFNGPDQVLKQVWFPGAHSNIGGGYREHGLSDTTFLWMLSELTGPPRLLAFDPRSIAGALDPEPAERYPAGSMKDSRTWFWRLMGCPVPRPVCIISETERVHESAWKRRDAPANLVPAGDIYKRRRRAAWLAAMIDPQGPGRTRAAPRSDFESQYAETRRGRPRPIAEIPEKLDFCNRLLKLVGVRG